MKLLGIKGFSPLGRIDQFFSEGCFPTKFNWTARSVDFVLAEYYRQYGNEKYLAVCYSDGGTVGHRIFLADRNCVGLIASGSLFPGRLESYFPTSSYKPILLIANQGDITGMGRHTRRAYEFYDAYGFPAAYVETRSMSWHKHEFANGLPFMCEWAKLALHYDLPVSPLSLTLRQPG